jgi:hypothetical protein
MEQFWNEVNGRIRQPRHFLDRRSLRLATAARYPRVGGMVDPGRAGGKHQADPARHQCDEYTAAPSSNGRQAGRDGRCYIGRAPRPWARRRQLVSGRVRLDRRSSSSAKHCAALGRDPSTLERAHFVGWAKQERPFASRDALEEFVGTYREAGIQRFIFIYGIGDSTTGQWANRAILDSYGVSLMAALSSALRQSQIDTFH